MLWLPVAMVLLANAFRRGQGFITPSRALLSGGPMNRLAAQRARAERLELEENQKVKELLDQDLLARVKLTVAPRFRSVLRLPKKKKVGPQASHVRNSIFVLALIRS